MPGTETRRWAAIVVAVVMVLSAALHAYWALGGKWLLPQTMNAEPGEIPPDMMTGPTLVITWIFVAGMLLAAFLALGRVRWVGGAVPQKLYAIGLWGFSLFMLAGGMLNILGPRNLDRFLFAPIFLSLAALAVYLALPERRGGRPILAAGGTS